VEELSRVERVFLLLLHVGREREQRVLQFVAMMKEVSVGRCID
jgi:hypothetical protein